MTKQIIILYIHKDKENTWQIFMAKQSLKKVEEVLVFLHESLSASSTSQQAFSNEIKSIEYCLGLEHTE